MSEYDLWVQNLLSDSGERKMTFHQQQKDKGLTQVRVWVPEGKEDMLRAYAERLQNTKDQETNPSVVKLISQIDQGVPKRQLMLQMPDFIESWNEALSKKLIVVHEAHGPLVTDEGVHYAGLT